MKSRDKARWSPGPMSWGATTSCGCSRPTSMKRSPPTKSFRTSPCERG